MMVDNFKILFMDNSIEKSVHYNNKAIQLLNWELEGLEYSNPDIIGMDLNTIRDTIKEVDQQIEELEKPLKPLREQKQALHDLLIVKEELCESTGELRKLNKIKSNPKKYHRFDRHTKDVLVQAMFEKWHNQDAAGHNGDTNK